MRILRCESRVLKSCRSGIVEVDKVEASFSDFLYLIDRWCVADGEEPPAPTDKVRLQKIKSFTRAPQSCKDWTKPRYLRKALLHLGLPKPYVQVIPNNLLLKVLSEYFGVDVDVGALGEESNDQKFSVGHK